MYLRTASGECYDAPTPNEAITQFLSDDGYRITIPIPGYELVIRRDPDTPTEYSAYYDESIVHDCSITIRAVR